ncbi:biliverdin-producing heme oxygenase [Pseudoalteromonas sp. J010]|uniref:biliverdin-producing heme oxygenase n=1 Tax=Pseudoalteromonas sp. J010 TaxID=998465 RepID=UPI000F653A50|nr:biliverdin-producing heme oxygenase [Pseudoalteromonas sp. J010]
MKIMPLHRKLRLETKAAHDKIELDSIFSYYFSSDLDGEMLLGILGEIYILYFPWQQSLNKFHNVFNLPEFMKIDLGVDLLTSLVPQVKLSSAVPAIPIHGIESYIGCVYVLQGSRMGNGMIYKRLLKNPNLPQTLLVYHKKLSYLQAGISWRAWMEKLERFCLEQNLDENRITQGACECFELLHLHFAKNKQSIPKLNLNEPQAK